MFNQIYIEITNSCNFKCWFCYRTKREYRDMSPSEFEIILNQIKGHTRKICLHVLGEPLSHPQIIEILKITEKFSFKVHLVTNGAYLESLENILINNHSIHLISLSLQAYHNNIPLSLLNTVHRIAEYKTFQLRHWFFKEQEDSITYTLKKFYQHETLHDCMMLQKNIYLSLSSPFEWPDDNAPFNSTDGTCLGTRKQVAILSNGQLTACCFDGDGKINLGNVFDRHFTELIHAPHFLKIKQGFQTNKIIEKTCQHCRYRERFV